MIVDFANPQNQSLLKWIIRNDKRLSTKLLINKNDHINVQIKPLNLLLNSTLNYVFAKC